MRERLDPIPNSQHRALEADGRPGARAEIRGQAAARGSASGIARVIMDGREFDRLESGEVLVCPSISPSNALRFAKASAVVTDSGGTLSNPATIAREYGIPLVVATGEGTKIVQDGQRVVVDGDLGVLWVLA